MTVGDAGSPRTAAHVLEDVYTRLALDQPVRAGIDDPLPLLAAHYGKKRANALAGFWDCCLLRGRKVTEERYPNTFKRHLGKLLKVGLTPHFGNEPRVETARVELPPIERPTIDVLAARRSA